FEFDPKDLVYVRIDRRRKLPVTILLRALGYRSEEILGMFFETNKFRLVDDKTVKLELVPARLRGDVATFTITDQDGNVIVEDGRRITARHIRQMEKAGVKELSVPREYLLGRSLAKDIVDSSTGEVVLECNTEISEDTLKTFAKSGINEIETIY